MYNNTESIVILWYMHVIGTLSKGKCEFVNVFQDGQAWVKKMKGVFCFKVKGSDGKEGIWVVDAKNGNGSVKFGAERMCQLLTNLSFSRSCLFYVYLVQDFFLFCFSQGGCDNHYD